MADEAQDPNAELEQRIARVANAAVTAHQKRAAESTAKMLADLQAATDKRFEELLSKVGATTQTPKEGEQPPPRVDPTSKLLEEKIAKLERANVESEARARAVETRSQRDTARQRAGEELSKRGLTPARTRAVLADLEQRGEFKLNDAGEPIVTVKRTRDKAKPNEPVEYEGYENLATAIGDWAQTPDAAEFLPPPSGVQRQTQPANNGIRRVGGSNATTELPKNASPSDMAAAAEAMLAAKGIDVREVR